MTVTKRGLVPQQCTGLVLTLTGVEIAVAALIEAL